MSIHVARLETLCTIKNPPVVYARQANIANGPQQVNNALAPSAHAGKSENEPNKLLEASNEHPMDSGASHASSSGNPAMEAVGAIDRTANS